MMDPETPQKVTPPRPSSGGRAQGPQGHVPPATRPRWHCQSGDGASWDKAPEALTVKGLHPPPRPSEGGSVCGGAGRVAGGSKGGGGLEGGREGVQGRGGGGNWGVPLPPQRTPQTHKAPTRLLQGPESTQRGEEGWTRGDAGQCTGCRSLGSVWSLENGVHMALNTRDTPVAVPLRGRYGAVLQQEEKKGS